MKIHITLSFFHIENKFKSLQMTVSPNTAEQAYLDLCKRIIDEGEHRPDRTGTGTKSLFAPPQLRFDLSNDTFPLLTTKKYFQKGSYMNYYGLLLALLMLKY